MELPHGLDNAGPGAREDTWWTPDMPADLQHSWHQLRGNALQFVVALPLLVAMAWFIGRGMSKTPPAESPFYFVTYGLVVLSVVSVLSGEILRRRLLPRAGIAGATEGARECAAANAVARATFAAFMFAQAPNFIGFMLVFMGLPFAAYLGFVGIALVGFITYYPTRARWEAAVRTALGEA